MVIGDSLSRYQYMSLIYVLSRPTPDTAQLPSVVYQHHGFKDMNAYYACESDGRLLACTACPCAVCGVCMGGHGGASLQAHAGCPQTSGQLQLQG